MKSGQCPIVCLHSELEDIILNIYKVSHFHLLNCCISQYLFLLTLKFLTVFNVLFTFYQFFIKIYFPHYRDGYLFPLKILFTNMDTFLKTTFQNFISLIVLLKVHDSSIKKWTFTIGCFKIKSSYSSDENFPNPIAYSLFSQLYKIKRNIFSVYISCHSIYS